LQVTETGALNGREMDEYVLSTFALDKAEAFVTIEPLDRTSYTFRHCICLLWQFENSEDFCFVPSEGKKNNPRIEP
jgi:hypothetical protein